MARRTPSWCVAVAVLELRHTLGTADSPAIEPMIDPHCSSEVRGESAARHATSSVPQSQGSKISAPSAR